MNKPQIGITDQPREQGADLLNTDAYAEGLCEFIERCPTPMSVALQGDWGSGKSSLLYHIRDELQVKGFKVILINTWQYSQINSGENLASIFMASLLEELDVSGRENLKNNIGRVAAMLGKVVLGAIAGDEAATTIDDVTHTDDIKLIKNLRDNFQKLVTMKLQEQESGKDRLVILVDDLDRLNPNAAVELLEVVKLFMDVEGCVFVLAIDYDVVVQGVRSKFGQDIPLEKCRSFFDKIVQLPFLMPVERYTLDAMIKEYLGDKLNADHIKTISGFASNVVGTNPRALKRLVNSFLLLEIIQGKLNSVERAGTETQRYSKEDNAILFCVLCVQARYTSLYTYISDSETWLETVSEGTAFFEEFGGDRETARVAFSGIISQYTDEQLEKRTLDNMLDTLEGLNEILYRIYPKNNKKKYEHLARVIRLSAVTSRGGTATEKAGKVSKTTRADVTLFGEKESYIVSSKAYIAVVEVLLAKYPDYIDKCLKECPNILTTDNEKQNGYHSARYELQRSVFTENGISIPIYLGTHMNALSKRDNLRRLCQCLPLKNGDAIWEDPYVRMDLVSGEQFQNDEIK